MSTSIGTMGSAYRLDTPGLMSYVRQMPIPIATPPAYSPTRTSGPIVLAGLYAGGVAIGIGIWRTYDINPGVSARYALPMAPVLVLILCAGIQRATAQKVFALGAFAFSTMSVWMIIQTPLV